jgi:hypothetical protein
MRTRDNGSNEIRVSAENNFWIRSVNIKTLTLNTIKTI